MNAYERAVIDAAMVYAADDGVDQHNQLFDAVEELIKHRRIGSLDRLNSWLDEHAEIRMRNSFRRNVRDSGQGRTADRFAGRWPERITTAEQFGEMPAYCVRDSWHAGPKTWAVWAEGLRAIGIEPAWARELGV